MREITYANFLLLLQGIPESETFISAVCPHCNVVSLEENWVSNLGEYFCDNCDEWHDCVTCPACNTSITWADRIYRIVIT